jgi:multidrug transporter EmrE-like cation transporter
MNRLTAISVLILAALLEAGGDAIMRIAAHGSSLSTRLLLFLVAAAVLTTNRWTVNAPPWDFGKLMGIYVVFFFVIGQLISWFWFKQQPSLSTIIAGLMIIGGGVVFTLGKQ